MTSLAMQWVQQQLSHCFYGKTHGQPGVAQAQKAGRDDQGSLAQQLFAVPPLLEQDTAWHLPCQEQQHLPRYHTGLPKTGVGNRNKEIKKILLEIKAFMGTGIPQELGLAPALCPEEPPEAGVPFPAGRAAHEQPPR